MARRALRLPALAFTVLSLALAACSSFPEAGNEGNILAPGNFRAGSGVIQSVGVLRNDAYRLYLHMDVGGFQSVDVDNGTFMAGEAVELTNDGRVVRVSGTSLNRVEP
jgi:hypothetical protein